MNGILIPVLIGLVVMLNIILLYKMIRFSKEGSEHKDDYNSIVQNIQQIEKAIREEFRNTREELLRAQKEIREELVNSFIKQQDNIISNFVNLSKSQSDNFSGFSKSLMDLSSSLSERLKEIRETVEKRLYELTNENSKKLEEMRHIVDEKLQKTLESRLTESFRQVSERLQQVFEGLGEMKTLATGVGDLKKVLSNVKTRGIFGEIQLQNILENILSPEQYERNIKIRPDLQERVEFAIRLPGRDTDSKVYLPIDSKFPQEAYLRLLDASERGDPEGIARSSKEIEDTIYRFAEEIKHKYIAPPYSTDFAIMFLPTEGLYAEIVKKTDIIERLQRDYKVVVTGPTTLAALLNSLQMGFRTVAIERRSNEVWEILKAVRTEFDKFADVLIKAREKISKAGEDIDQLVGTRTKKIQKCLKDVERLPESKDKSFIFERDED